ncbi:MAG TPA: hypothetical protein PKK69_09350, partial [Ferruginibacter sp.]|nr:hypothetical protein [Ferruginibacter sp.]
MLFRFLTGIAVFLCMTGSVLAQESPKEKKPHSAASSLSVKHTNKNRPSRSTIPAAHTYSNQINPIQPKLIVPPTSPVNKKSTPPSSTPLFNYGNLPLDVKTKVDRNKQTGRPALDGIEKAYSIKMPDLQTDVLVVRKLAFLKKETRVLHYKLLQPGIVEIAIDPDMKSEDLKALL